MNSREAKSPAAGLVPGAQQQQTPKIIIKIDSENDREVSGSGGGGQNQQPRRFSPNFLTIDYAKQAQPTLVTLAPIVPMGATVLSQEQRRPSIFDYMNEEEIDFDSEHEDTSVLLKMPSKSSNLGGMSSNEPSYDNLLRPNLVPLLQISSPTDSFDNDKIEFNEDISSPMEVENDLVDKFRMASAAQQPQQPCEKRVEFSIGYTKLGPATKSNNNSAHVLNRPPPAPPKSALKRFQIDSHSLMSQNVDENEEYELDEKEKHQQPSNRHHIPRSSLAENLDAVAGVEERGEGESANLIKPPLKKKSAHTITNTNNYLNLDNSLDSDLTRVSTLILNKDNSGFDNEKQMLSCPTNDQRRVSQQHLNVGDPSGDLDANNNISNNSKVKKSKFKLSSRKVKQSLKPKDYCTPTHEIFVGLEQLCLVDNNNNLLNEPIYEWREVSRWIKYEQTIDPETNIWSKPSIGALVYQSLLYLRTGLQYGTVLLNCEQESFGKIVDEIVNDFVDSGHMNKENRELIKRSLLSQHRASFSVSGLTRKKSTMSEFFPIGSRRQSTFTGDPIFNSLNSENASTNTSRKNSSVQFGELNSNKSKDKKLSMSEFNLQNKYNSQYQKQQSATRENSVKFFVQPSVPNSENNSDNNINGNIYKRRRSTIAMLKNTLTQTKLNKSDNSIKGVSADAEAFLVYIGVVDYLDRPVMGFVRLLNSQILDDVCESPIKVRFLFILLGPKNDSIDYLEIGRCVGTLMTNKEFHECAYRANDRRELIEAITAFTNRSLCLVLPLGEFDDDLLTPLIEWIKAKMKKKLEKHRNESRSKSNDKTAQSPAKSRKSISHINRDKLLDLESGYAKKASMAAHHHNAKDNSVSHGSGGGVGVGSGGGGGAGGGGGGNDGTDGDDPYDNDDDDEEFDPFKRTGYLFGSLCNEIKYRYSKYLSDFKDAFNVHCLIAFVFIFTVCIAPALSFGGILADKTNKWFGVNEMLIATSLNGIISGLFSGQPLMILGPTGPFLVFEEMLFTFCKHACIEFLAVRCWVSMWVLIFAIIMLACEGVYVIRYVTRFTEEIFAILIASVFLSDAVKKIYNIFSIDPIYKTEIYCNDRNTSLLNPMNNLSSSSISLDNEVDQCRIYLIDKPTVDHQPRPNIALLSLMLLIGTCSMALSLKKLRRSIFLGAVARRTLSDVGMLISIILMVLVDSVIKKHTGLETPKLDIPQNGFVPTNQNRKTWLVSPFGTNIDAFAVWIPFAAFFPALLVFIVLFFEVELTGMILHSKHRKLKKGTGFNLDLLIAALLMNLNSCFGLPWMCAAPVRTLAHWASLSVYSKTYIPGEKPKLIDVKEQRVTNICVHLAIGLCLLARDVLKKIPISVIFGIFLYFGIVSLSGTQLYERIKLFFIPSKYCPNATYARGVRPSKRNLFTVVQVLFIFILLAMKSFNKVSYFFPLVLVCLVPVRIYILPKIFSQKELEQLDCPDEMTHDNDSALDFYEITHLPI